MARRMKVVVIDDAKSRDNGKQFQVTEMDADSAEWWAFRVLQALLGSDAQISFDVPLAQMARQGLGALAKLPPEQARPLLEEMVSCWKVQLPGGKVVRDLLDGDIEEVKTRILLRKATLELHTDFFGNGE